MQTITIAVSAILVAAGLITAPGLINNARDDNATGDLANIAYAEEGQLATDSSYNPTLFQYEDLNGQPVPKTATHVLEDTKSLQNQPNIKFTPSGIETDTLDFAGQDTYLEGVHNYKIDTCYSGGQSHYLIQDQSGSGTYFYRSSDSAAVTSNLSILKVAPCISEIGFSEPNGGTPIAPPPPTPLVTVLPSDASATYTVAANSYNVYEILLENVTITSSSASKENWEIRINKSAPPLDDFASVTGISAEDSRVTCTDDGAYYSCIDNQPGQYGNGVSSSSSFSVTLVIGATLDYVTPVSIAQAPVTGGAYYATQNITVSTTYPVYGYWMTNVDLSALKATGTNAPWICINNSNASIAKNSNGTYAIKSSNSYFAIESGAPVTFTVSASTSNNGNCVQ